jgi:hypothetical protein
MGIIDLNALANKGRTNAYYHEISKEIELNGNVELKLDGNLITITRGIIQVESYLLDDVDTQAKILRYSVMLLEKEWVTKGLVLAFIKLAANCNNIKHR